MMKVSKIGMYMSAENISKDENEPISERTEIRGEFNAGLSRSLIDPESGQQVQIITVDKFLDYTDTTGCSPQSAKKFLATLCNQAEHGNSLVFQCLFPSPWLPWKILKEGTQPEHGIRVDRAALLYEHLTNDSGSLRKFERGYGIGQDAVAHFRHILDNLYSDSV